MICALKNRKSHGELVPYAKDSGEPELLVFIQGMDILELHRNTLPRTAILATGCRALSAFKPA